MNSKQENNENIKSMFYHNIFKNMILTTPNFDNINIQYEEALKEFYKIKSENDYQQQTKKL